MKLSIHIKPNAHRNEVTKLDDTTYRVSVTAPPIEGRANEKLIEVLAEYFGRPKWCVRILRGETSRQKLVEID